MMIKKPINSHAFLLGHVFISRPLRSEDPLTLILDHTVEGLRIASRKAYEFIGFLIIMLKNNIETYGF